ncbi:putative Fructokinase [Rhodotorula taiwanensis]|uniref:Putative Fructokinase n=1 Tax=Rhodotorula taiwanensis TaxID=741276 RepID=A0A2S5BFD6_9BASI|nr:putative Fructokinase [Rhodotorula taiwanensis]
MSSATPHRPITRPTRAVSLPPPISFRPLTRAPSTSEAAWQQADAPLGGVYDLPEAEAMTRLERTLSSYTVDRRRAADESAEHERHLGRQQQIDTLPQASGAHGSAGVPSTPPRARTCSSATLNDEKAAEEESKDGPDSYLTAEERLVYSRFSPRRKRVIVAIVSYCALLAPFSSSSFLPSIPQIVDDLHTTATVINVTVAVFILAIGLFPLIWAPYSGVYGRRPIFLISLPIFALGCLGTALSKSLAALIVTRIIQALGSSPVLSIGAGTISDLYPKHERGTAMGLFYLGVLVGPATAPAVAGILTEYVRPKGYGWRAMQFLLMGLGASAFVLVLLAFPETAHVRGIDAIRSERAGMPADKQDPEKCDASLNEEVKRAGWIRRKLDGFTWVWLNPLAPVRLLMHPNIAAMSLNSSFTLMSTYTILVPLSQTVAPRYNITNAAILGCFYLAQGVGNAVASRYTGRYADWMLKRWLRRRKGVYVPEDRLYASLIGGGCILPLSVLALGWVLEKGSGKVGLAWVAILLFVDGIGLMCVLTPCNTYCVDVLSTRSSEVIAINNACRYAVAAGASAFVLPMIQAIGVGWTNTFAALIVWLGCGVVLLTIRYGARMRAFGERWEGSRSAGNDLPEDALRERDCDEQARK